MLTPVTNLWRLRADPPGFLLRLALEYGPAVSFRLLGRRFYFFSGPEGVREVLVSCGPVMQKGFLLGRVWKQILALMGNGLLTSEEPLHGRQRKLVVPAFHRERLAGYAKIMTDALDIHAAARWTDGATLEMSAELSALTLVIVARALFGTELGGRAATVRNALSTFPEMMLRMRSPWQQWQYSPAMRTFRLEKAKLDAVVAEIVAERRQSGEADDRGDLLSMLLLARDEETGGPGMSDTQVRDEVMTLMLAGHETTAGALSWTLHLLGQNPAAGARLQAEVDAVLADGRLPTFADLPRLIYTRQVLTESMRLYPPAWIMGRRATEPVEIAGWQLPGGSMCLVSPYATQRNPALFADPERFSPERWDAGQDSGRPKYAYFPFGGGSRSCAGEAFAWMEGTLLLAGLARRWRFVAAEGHPRPELLAAVTLRPRHGVWMHLQARA